MLPGLGLAIGAKAVGSIFAGIGASKRAKEIKKATGQAQKRVSAFADEFTGESKELKERKLGILGESENIFDRLGGFIFGDTDSLTKLREAQSEFSALAAGDTSGFTSEIESIVKSALAGTFGSPKGAFENLSARNLFNFRSQGLQNALSLTNQLSGLGSSLINTEFGIHDQDFQNRLSIRENEVRQLNALSLQGAQTAGTGAAGIGNVFNTLGQGAFSYANMLNQNRLFEQYNLPSHLRSQQSELGGSYSSVGIPMLGPVNTSSADSFQYEPAYLPTGAGGVANTLLPLLPGQRSVDYVSDFNFAPPTRNFSPF